MKRTMGLLAGALLGTGLVLLISAASAGEALNAVAIAQHLDKTKYTTTEVKNYIKDLKGKQVIAQGKVHEVLTGRTGTVKVVLYVDVPNKSTYFIVDTIVEDATGIHKNDRMTCTGEYLKYNMFSLNGITIKGSCKK